MRDLLSWLYFICAIKVYIQLCKIYKMKTHLSTKIPLVWLKYYNYFQFFVLRFSKIEVKITRDVRTDIRCADPEFIQKYVSTRQPEQITYLYRSGT